MESVHGHEVMYMMMEREDGYTREELVQAIIKRFGEGTVFHTCSAQGMTPEQLIDLMEAKGKFNHHQGMVQTSSGHVCSH